MSSSWEAGPGCREMGDALSPLGLRRWGSWVLTEGPCHGMSWAAFREFRIWPCHVPARQEEGGEKGRRQEMKEGVVGREITRNPATQHKSS